MNPEQNFESNYNGTKATEALHVVEIAEHILSFLDIRAIIKTTRVCKRLRNTLATSSKLRTLTFLAPEPQPATFVVGNKKHLNWYSRADIAFNPLVFERIDQDDDDDGYIAAILGDTDVLYLPSSDYALEYNGLWVDESENHSTLRIDCRIDDPAATERIAESPGSARDMLLAYQQQPKDMQIELVLTVHEDRAFRFDVLMLVTVSGKITLGGLCDVLNLLWAGMPGLKEEGKEGGSITREDFLGKAREMGSGAVKWMKGDAKYNLTM
ncbi:hypothetical protein AC579_9141 [Pseudocercospora musae]|uniref:F-box domain-containing protein n=1 Tax=Pseudocercospora musae TaxID=113226 RepID=A0A139IIS3_9PEZI|nr:hypothetical protein AC579_9141 [Pseudocercospora musae]